MIQITSHTRWVPFKQETDAQDLLSNVANGDLANVIQQCKSLHKLPIKLQRSQTQWTIAMANLLRMLGMKHLVATYQLPSLAYDRSKVKN